METAGCGSFFLLLALMLGMAGFAPRQSSSVTAPNGPTATPIMLRTIVVAVKPVACGSRIKPGDLAQAMWPAAGTSDHNFTDVNQVINRVARVAMYPGEAITDNLLADKPAQVKC